MLPAGWVHVPVREGTVAAVDRLLAKRFAHVGRDQVAPLRRALRVDLLTLADDARRTGGVDLYLLLDAPDEVPVDASLVVSLVAPDSVTPQIVALLDGADATATTVELRFIGPALRYETRRPPLEGGTLSTGRSTTRVQYVVDAPGRGSQLMLTFVTTTEPVADQLVTLFDAMAGTLGFVDRPRLDTGRRTARPSA